MKDCVFCKIARREAPADVLIDWDHCLAFVPLKPVTPGHVLVIPRSHLDDFRDDPTVTAEVMRCAALYASAYAGGACNLITSAGADATQTVFHLHVHVVPRRAGDGLHLPWTGQH